MPSIIQQFTVYVPKFDSLEWKILKYGSFNFPKLLEIEQSQNLLRKCCNLVITSV